MKVLHIIQHLKHGGIEQLAVTFLSLDVEHVYILAIEGTSQESLKDWPQLEQFRSNLFFANKNKGFSIKTVKFIKQICQDLNISVLHTHHIGPLIYGCLATVNLKTIKHVHTEHDIWHLHYYKDWLIQYFLFKVKKKICLVAVSHYVYTYLKNYFPKLDATVIYNAVNTNLFVPGNKKTARERFNLPQEAAIIGTAGRLEEIKGQKYLIEAMQYLPTNFYLVIAGNGSLYQNLQAHIHQLYLTDRVFLFGLVEQMQLFYQACDIFCLPSLNEGMPLALLEAQACNIPVVCSNVGGCSEGVDPDSGILVTTKDPAAIALACLQIKPDNIMPREFILKYFSFEQMLSSYYKIYEKTYSALLQK